MLLTLLYNLSYINFIETTKSPSVAQTTWSVTHILPVSEIIMNTKVDEGKLISGKEALIALANGESVQKRSDSWAGDHWVDISKKEPFNLECFLSGLNRNGETIKFRLKPRTISINGVEVPAPFEPGKDDAYWVLNTNIPRGYERKKGFVVCLAWRTEEEVQQVIAALRQVSGGSHDN